MQVHESRKEYIINLNTVRSRRALISAIIVSVCTFIAVVNNALDPTYTESSFHYFTTISNLISAAGAMFMIPYAVEGIRRKRFTMPRWISLFQYAGAVSVFITMFCALTIISYTLGPVFAFTEDNFWLHLVNPVLAIILFLLVETDQKLTKRDTVLSLIPYWIYVIIYIIMVVYIGEERGGWEDIYNATSTVPLWIVFNLLILIGFAASIILRKLHNLIVDRSLKDLTSRWEGYSSVELRIEAYGLGRKLSRRLDKNEIVVPIDIFRMMAQKCDVSIEDLTRAYIKGVEDGMNK
ncbi:MAG: DUF1600 domain-containing protein [Lachnospiraceae bacterium]|nr:DUF1600 domain-containing protein [Lachnospiraceae bacterium]